MADLTCAVGSAGYRFLSWWPAPAPSFWIGQFLAAEIIQLIKLLVLDKKLKGLKEKID